MQDTDFIKKFFDSIGSNTDNQLLLNRLYFTSLLEFYRKGVDSEVRMFHPDTSSDSNCLPFALIPKNERESVQLYRELGSFSTDLSEYRLVTCKMHAGLGTSVEREKHLAAHTKRKSLGSKGTDLFIKFKNKSFSLAELQLEQLKIIQSQKYLQSVSMLNLVNEETREVIEDLYLEDKNFTSSVMQYKVPTLNSIGELTARRVAPAGHGYLGFYLLWEIFKSPRQKKFITIGNGEDLNSTPDKKMLSWMGQEKVPITMITTTKLDCDRKGGQIARCSEDGTKYFTIVEKAQAERVGQLDYFTELGLRENDNEALFNTNIVILNVEAIKSIFSRVPDLTEEKLLKALTPSVIKNIKEQNGENFTQLEGALGSVVLNLDKYFRLNFGEKLVHFLNLDSVEREEFFIPIKKMQDFEDILTHYNYSEETGRLVKPI